MLNVCRINIHKESPKMYIYFLFNLILFQYSVSPNWRPFWFIFYYTESIHSFLSFPPLPSSFRLHFVVILWILQSSIHMRLSYHINRYCCMQDLQPMAGGLPTICLSDAVYSSSCTFWFAYIYCSSSSASFPYSFTLNNENFYSNINYLTFLNKT